MPAKSRAQFRFMEMLAHNPEKMKNKPEWLSSDDASEYTSSNKGELSYKNLPEKAPKFTKLRTMMKEPK